MKGQVVMKGQVGIETFAVTFAYSSYSFCSKAHITNKLTRLKFPVPFALVPFALNVSS